MVSDGEPDSRSPGESDGLEVRRFATGDALAVRALDDAAISAAGARGRGDEDLDSVATSYFEDGGEFLVGILDGRPIAIGALRHVTDAVAELNRMRVHPGLQRRGFGRTILVRLEHRPSELGYRTPRLHTPRPRRRRVGSTRRRGTARSAAGQLAGTEVVYFEKTLA